MAELCTSFGFSITRQDRPGQRAAARIAEDQYVFASGLKVHVVRSCSITHSRSKEWSVPDLEAALLDIALLLRI